MVRAKIFLFLHLVSFLKNILKQRKLHLLAGLLIAAIIVTTPAQYSGEKMIATEDASSSAGSDDTAKEIFTIAYQAVQSLVKIIIHNDLFLIRSLDFTEVEVPEPESSGDSGPVTILKILFQRITPINAP